MHWHIGFSVCTYIAQGPSVIPDTTSLASQEVTEMNCKSFVIEYLNCRTTFVWNSPVAMSIQPFDGEKHTKQAGLATGHSFMPFRHSGELDYFLKLLIWNGESMSTSFYGQ